MSYAAAQEVVRLEIQTVIAGLGQRAEPSRHGSGDTLFGRGIKQIANGSMLGR